MTSGVELHLFSSGLIEVGAGGAVPVPFFLIRHPQGSIVVDGGIPLEAAQDARAYWGPLADRFAIEMTEDQHCVAQLAAVGVAPEAITHVVNTHLHLDHTGALGHFPDAAVVVHAAELDAARATDPSQPSGYVRRDFDRPRLRWQPFDGDLDLFGDGSVQLLQTPGHAAGHVSILLQLDATGPVLLTADAADNRAQWEGRQHTRAFFSRDAAKASLQRLRSIAEDTGALIIFGHDPENWAGLQHAPECYR